jgi:hypothetical protein
VDGYPGDGAIARDDGEGPGSDGDAGQFLCPGDGIIRLLPG